MLFWPYTSNFRELISYKHGPQVRIDVSSRSSKVCIVEAGLRIDLAWVSGVCFKGNEGWEDHHHIGVAMRNCLQHILLVEWSTNNVRKCARKCRFHHDKLLTMLHPWSRLFDPCPEMCRILAAFARGFVFYIWNISIILDISSLQILQYDKV